MKPPPIVYIALVETITSPGCKVSHCTEIFQFFESVRNNGFPQHTQFPNACEFLSIRQTLLLRSIR